MLVLLVALLVPGAGSALAEEDEELLVDLHNHYRGLVSPSASAMLPLKWDPDLKAIAEAYAAKCIWNHNIDLEDIGENLFADNGPLNLSEAIEKWFMERLDYNYQNNSCDGEKMCGHYTQMVWADTHRVGCAIHLCNTMEGLDWEKVNFLVCNYIPPGNYEDMHPYVEGDSCSQCPENLQKCVDNLCVSDTEEEEMTDEMTVLQPSEILPTELQVSPDPQSTPASIPSILATNSIADFADTPLPGIPADTAVFPRSPSASPPKEREADRNDENQVKGRDEIRKRSQPPKIPKLQASTGSVLKPPFLLASLTGVLALCL